MLAEELLLESRSTAQNVLYVVAVLKVLQMSLPPVGVLVN